MKWVLFFFLLLFLFAICVGCLFWLALFSGHHNRVCAQNGGSKRASSLAAPLKKARNSGVNNRLAGQNNTQSWSKLQENTWVTGKIIGVTPDLIGPQGNLHQDFQNGMRNGMRKVENTTQKNKTEWENWMRFSKLNEKWFCCTNHKKSCFLKN